MKFLNYIAVSLAIFTMVSCDDNVEAVRTGGDNDKLTIQHQFGKNLVGRVTVDGVPREGVVVSDGITVMTTDANGEYQMYTTGRQHVFISVPEDCEVPVFNGHPKFYKTLDFSNDAIIQRDFQLRSCNKKTEWTLFTMADVQIGNGDVNDYSNVVMPQILDFTQTLTNNTYGINVGDIVWNTPSLFETYKTQVAKTLIPTFNVIGNHDHNEGIKNDTESDRDYRNALGPTYYSVNIGDCHLVVLDDVLYRGVDGRNDYSGTITQAQLDWLEEDLSYVSKDHNDIDIFVEKNDYQNFIEIMKANGFYEIKMEYTTLNHTVWEDLKNRIIDLHCFEYTDEGEILYDGDCFPVETFSGKGRIEEIEVSCIEPYSQVMFHLGYEFDENDAHDVKLLCETLHIEIPNEYR